MGKLTDRQLQLIKTAKDDLFLNDGGGLYFRVRPSGSKSWLYRYKTGTKTHWFDLGDYPTLTLAESRALAARLTADRRSGIDPVERRQREEEARRTAEAAAKTEAARRAARLTVRQLFERWERLELSGRKDGGGEVRRCFEKDVFLVIGEVAAVDVTRTLVAQILDAIVERGARIVARRMLSDIRQMYGFAIARGLVEHDPTSHMKRDDFGKKVERDRILSESEIKELQAKLPVARLLRTTELAIQLMLSTCCRVGELSQARWEHVDLGHGTWRIPPANAKNGKEHLIHLSDFAKRQFEWLHEITGHGDWCYPAEHRDGPVCLKSISKQIRDRQRITALMNRSKATGVLLLTGGEWTPHDLRRTGATLMGNLGVRPDVIERCLNHVEPNRLVRTYQRQRLEEEQREAWRLLGQRLAILTSGADNVIPLKRPASSQFDRA